MMCSVEEFNKFKTLCNEVIDCKFIIAETRIVKLLKFLAESPPFFAVIEEVLKDFNYGYELSKCKVPIIKSSPIKYSLVLPTDLGKRIALIFYILYEIDMRKLDLRKFINDFFIVEDELYESYKKFTDAVILPFITAFEELFFGKDEEDLPVNSVAISSLNDETEPAGYGEILEFVKKIAEITEGESIKAGLKQEIIIITDGFIDSIIAKKPKMILYMWIGYKNTLKECKKTLFLLKKIEDEIRSLKLF